MTGMAEGNNPPAAIDPATWTFKGEGVAQSRRTIGDLKGVFADEAARAAMEG